MGGLMPKYSIQTTVHFTFEVEADNEELAEKQGWNYEDYLYNGEVYDIEVTEIEEEEEDEDE
jgi:hypothetical protein